MILPRRRKATPLRASGTSPPELLAAAALLAWLASALLPGLPAL